MKQHSAFIWRVRLSLFLLAFGSLILREEEAAEAPAPNLMVASPGALAVEKAAGRRAAPKPSPRRTDSGQRHLVHAGMRAAITAPGPQ